MHPRRAVILSHDRLKIWQAGELSLWLRRARHQLLRAEEQGVGPPSAGQQVSQGVEQVEALESGSNKGKVGLHGDMGSQGSRAITLVSGIDVAGDSHP